MPYSLNFRDAARRHLDAASRLRDGRTDVAGYLYGIAAECAVKHMARGIPAARSDEILYAHFPVLRTRLRDVLTGRNAQTLRRLIEDDGFMNQWHVKMRYAPGSEIKPDLVEKWGDQAKRAVNTMDT